MSAQFAGFVLGAFLCVRIGADVGHIRPFAAVAAVATAITLTHVPWLDVLPRALLCFVHGLAMVATALIIASWLNAETAPERRGGVFAAYMVVKVSAPAVGQLLSSTGEAGGFEPAAVRSEFAPIFATSREAVELVDGEPAALPDDAVPQA